MGEEIWNKYKERGGSNNQEIIRNKFFWIPGKVKKIRFRFIDINIKPNYGIFTRKNKIKRRKSLFTKIRLSENMWISIRQWEWGVANTTAEIHNCCDQPDIIETLKSYRFMHLLMDKVRSFSSQNRNE